MFQGAYWQLAERYTNMTNILFLTFFYSSIFPVGFFLSSLALMIHYWTDKFCLLRNWSRAPKLGSEIAFSSGYFFTAAVVFFAVMLAYLFASSPYDNACREDSVADDKYVGDFVARDLDGNEVQISVPENATNYFYCSQDMIRYSPIAFPPIASKQPYGQEWMSSDQERTTNLLGYTALGIVIFCSLRMVFRFLIGPIRSRLSQRFTPRGTVGTEKFTELNEICAYIPQAKLYGYGFPLILCDLRHVSNDYIGWTSPMHSHEFYSIVNDIPSLKGRSLFAAAKQWIPVSSSSEPVKEQHQII